MRALESTLVNQRIGRYEPIHARCYCAVIAAGVAGVAAAGVSAYGASQQGKATDAAMQASKDNAEAIYGTKPKAVAYKSHVNLPAYSPETAGQDYWKSLPLLAAGAQAVTNTNMRMRDKLTGGMASDNLMQTGVNINQMIHGNAPNAVVDRVNRLVAERGAGAYTPGGPAGQMAQEDFARSIGKTSYDIMTQGMTYAPQWESLVDSFTYKPQQALGDALNMLRARQDYAKTQMELDQNEYIAKLNYERTLAGKDPMAAGQFSDQLTLGTLQEKQQQNQIDAYAGLIKSVGGLGASFKPDAASAYAANPYSAGVGYTMPKSATQGPQPGTYYV